MIHTRCVIFCGLRGFFRKCAIYAQFLFIPAIDMKNYPERKHTRLSGFDYSTPGAYFVTVCTNERACFFANDRSAPNPVGADLVSTRPITQMKSLYDQTSEAAYAIAHTINLTIEKFITVDIPCYTIMPDHMHMIIILKKYDDILLGDSRGPTPGRPLQEFVQSPSLPDVMQYFLSRSTLEYTNLVHQHLARPYHGHLWQRSYYDHIIRSRDEYRAICRYIAANPQKLHTHP